MPCQGKARSCGRGLRSIAAGGYERNLDGSFEERLTTVVAGIAVRNGLAVDDEVIGRAAIG